MSENILVPVDSITYDNTLLAVEKALEIASDSDSESSSQITFFNVWDEEDFTFVGPDGLDAKEVRRSKMEEEFEKIGEMCEKKDFQNYETVFKSGESAHKEIVEKAREMDADLIVMGSGKLRDKRTEGEIERFRYGDIAEHVIHESPCSVLIARPKKK
ncbi:MAG: universal stress protein [Candidatus Aenigmatarchaeota archaeon]